MNSGAQWAIFRGGGGETSPEGPKPTNWAATLGDRFQPFPWVGKFFNFKTFQTLFSSTF